MTITNECPNYIEAELWANMSADARYQAQLHDAKADLTVEFIKWILAMPPLLFMALPPAQTFVERFVSPVRHVQIDGSYDPRRWLDESPVEKGQRVGGFEVTSGFGLRSVLDLPAGASADHKGVDLATPEGTPLYAPAVGKDNVTVRCWQDAAGGGTVAEISSQSIKDYRFKALHLSTCEDGQYLSGQVFARSGDTGIGAPHLDWRQLSVDSDSALEPTAGYLDWVLSGSVGVDLIDLATLKDSIIAQESAGDAAIVNPHSGALGLGQVMPENIEGEGTGWDFEALGRDVSTNEFLNSSDLQNQIIEYKLGEIAHSQAVDADGSVRDDLEIAQRAAAVWYSGRADYCQSGRAEYFAGGTYPSGAEYCTKIGQRYRSLQEQRLDQLDR